MEVTNRIGRLHWIWQEPDSIETEQYCWFHKHEQLGKMTPVIQRANPMKDGTLSSQPT